MTHADLDDLAALVLHPDDVTEELRRHVASCPDCDALLTSLADVRRMVGEDELVPAPERVREQMLSHVRSANATDSSGDQVARSAPLTVDGPSRPTARLARRTIPAWGAGLAAATALIAGLGVGRLTGGADTPEAVEPPGISDRVVAAADLTTLDTNLPRGMASAVRTDKSIILRVSTNVLGAKDGFREVWLINRDGIRMVALGVLAAGDDGEFEVPMGLIEEGYRTVDISIEPDDGDPTHSGVSLARGELA